MLHNNLGVSLADYSGNADNHAFFGQSNVSAEELSELNKALEAGSVTGGSTVNSTTASGAPLKVESLENTLKVLTFKETDIQFWKRIPKLPAYNTVEEFNQLASYGTDAGVFTNEGELPREEDSLYVRKAEIVKFLGVTKSVSHPMQLVRTHIGSVIQQEIKNGTLFLLRRADRALAFADSSIVPQEFNGLIAQQRNSFTDYNTYMNSEVVIDLKGKALSEASLEDGALAIISNFGQANLLMAPPVVLSDFVKQFHDSKFIQPNTVGLTNGIVGQRVQKFQSQYGEIELGYDVFLNAAPARTANSPATHANAPAKVVSVSKAAINDAGFSKFAASDAGDYLYAVAAKNRYGESQLTLIGEIIMVSVLAGQSVDIKFIDGGGTNPATGYVIYRTEKSPSADNAVFYPIFEVSKSQEVSGFDGGSANSVRDRNRLMPNTNQALLLQSDTDVYSFKQLAPLMKMDLATLSPATRFMILMYGTPMLYAPKKMVRFINIGRAIK